MSNAKLFPVDRIEGWGVVVWIAILPSSAFGVVWLIVVSSKVHLDAFPMF